MNLQQAKSTKAFVESSGWRIRKSNSAFAQTDDRIHVTPTTAKSARVEIRRGAKRLHGGDARLVNGFLSAIVDKRSLTLFLLADDAGKRFLSFRVVPSQDNKKPEEGGTTDPGAGTEPGPK